MKLFTLWNPADAVTGALREARLAWQAQRSHGTRIGVPIPSDYSFRPGAEMSAWTPGRSLDEIARISRVHRIPIIFCGLRHAQGGPNGWGNGEPRYHGREPLLNAAKLEAWWRNLWSWAVDAGVVLAPYAQDGNEVG
jgi:hypothetical protein